jgi:hypothetical protein
MITEINRSNLKTLGDEIEEALQSIAKKHGVQIEVKGGNFGPKNAMLKVEIATKTQDGIVLTREAKTFLDYADLIGFKKEDLGRTFKYHDALYQITGYNPRKKNGILATQVGTGRGYAFPLTFIRQFLEEKAQK